MQAKLWDVLFEGGWDEADRLYDEGRLDSFLYRHLRVRGVMTNDPVTRQDILSYFLTCWLCPEVKVELFDYLNIFSPGDFVKIVIEGELRHKHEVLCEYLIRELRRDRLRLARIITTFMRLDRVSVAGTITILTLCVRLISGGIFNYSGVLDSIPERHRYELRIPLIAAFGDLNEACHPKNWVSVKLCLLTATEISELRLDSLVKTYYSWGLKFETLLSIFADAFVTNPITSSINTVRVIERAIICNSRARL